MQRFTFSKKLGDANRFVDCCGIFRHTFYMYFIPLVLLGLGVGSFINVLIDRIPQNKQVFLGRSICDTCHHSLSWRDLVPVLSWVLLGRACRYCHAPIPGRNTLVELLAVLLFITSFWFVLAPFCTVSSIPSCIHMSITEVVIIISLLSIFFIDLRHYIIPDMLTLILLGAGIVRLFIVWGEELWYTFVLSGLSAFVLFAVLVVVTRGRGMGIGDVKYVFVMGLLLGYPRIVHGLYAAFLTGALVGAILLVQRKRKIGQTIPFGPFLVLGTLVAHYHLLDPVAIYLFGGV